MYVIIILLTRISFNTYLKDGSGSIHFIFPISNLLKRKKHNQKKKKLYVDDW